MVLAGPDERETCPFHFSLRLIYDGEEDLVWSDCLWDLDTDVLVDSMVFVRDAQYPPQDIYLICMACFLLCSSAMSVYDSQALFTSLNT